MPDTQPSVEATAKKNVVSFVDKHETTIAIVGIVVIVLVALWVVF